MDTLLSLALTLLCTALLLIMTWRRRVFEAFEGTNIPGPPPSSWLWGHLYDYWEPTSVDRFDRWCDQYGDTFGFYMGDHPFVVTKDVDLLKLVFIRDFNNFVSRGLLVVRDALHPRVKNTLVFAEGNTWRRSRAKVAHALSVGNVKKMMPAMHQAVDEFLDRVGGAADRGEDLNVSETFSDLTFGVIGKGAFGIDTDAQKSREHPIFAVTLKTNPAFMTGFAYAFFQCLSSARFLLKPLVTLHGRLFGNPLLTLAEAVEPVVRMRGENPALRRQDMLQHLVDAEVGTDDDDEQLSVTESSDDAALTSERACLNSASVFVAGYDTTRLALTYWSFFVAKWPEVQSKMRAEVRGAMEKHGHLDYQAVVELQYTTQVIKETLRLSTPVPTFSARLAAEDYRYKDIVVKKGTSIMAATYQIHHDPDLWPDPEVFDPDRFSLERKDDQPQMAFLPFGVGPRNCVGMKLAMIEMVYTAAMTVLNFHLSLADRQKPTLELHSYSAVLEPKYGVWIRFRRLDASGAALRVSSDVTSA